MSIARHQPDLTLSLAPGETLQLRSLPLRRQEKWIVGLFMGFVLLAGLDGFVLYWQPNIIRQVESLIYGAFHALRLVSVGQLVAPNVAPVSTAQWALAAGPLLIGVFFLANMIVSRGATFHETIIADDRGLTWTSPLWRTRFIAWGDVQRFVARGAEPSYCVFGSQETISFHAPQPKGAEAPIAPPEETITPPSQARNWARLAKEAYDAEALQLVATIVARGGKPLLLVGGPNYTAEDVAAAPLADVRTMRQVMAAPTEGDDGPDEKLLLEAMFRPSAAFRWSLRWAPLTPVAFLILLFMLFPAPLVIERVQEPFTLAILLGGSVFMWLAVVLLTPLMRTQHFRNTHPAVMASDKIVALLGYNDKVLTRVVWGDLRAWAMQRSTKDGADVVSAHGYGWSFIVVTNEDKLLAWDEPADAELADAQLATPEARRAAYRARASSTR